MNKSERAERERQKAQRFESWRLEHGYTIEEAIEAREKIMHEREEVHAWFDKMAAWETAYEERDWMREHPMAVKEFLDAIKVLQNSIKRGPSLIKYNRYSPEAARFAIRRIDQLIFALMDYEKLLESAK